MIFIGYCIKKLGILKKINFSICPYPTVTKEIKW